MRVGEKETFARNEGAGSAIIEPHGTQLQLARKLIGDGKPILFGDRRLGHLIEKPHAFVTPKEGGRKGENEAEMDN